MSNRRSIIEDRSFLFAISIIKTYKCLVDKEKEYILSKQLVRSGTAIGALVREAQNAESTKDFIHKLSIVQKECDETIYWVDLLKITKYLNDTVSKDLTSEAMELLKMIKSAILTSRKKLIPS